MLQPTTARRVRSALNLLNLSTPLGLAVALAGGARLRRDDSGLWLGEGYRLPLPRAGAFTVGDVVTTPGTFAGLTAAQPEVMGHEERHAWQYAVAGLGFLPLYAAASGWSWLRSGSPAVLNFFERDAGLVAGGYLAEGVPVPHWSGRGLRVSGRRGGARSGFRGGADAAGGDA